MQLNLFYSVRFTVTEGRYNILTMPQAYLLLNGENAKEHAVFTELTRLRQYFEKIKKAEAGPLKRDLSLDKQAAGRFIKHALVRLKHRNICTYNAYTHTVWK